MRQTRNIAIFLSGLSILAMVLLMRRVVAREVTGPLGGEPAAAAEALKRFAQGDLRGQIPVATGDRDSLMASMAFMQQSLRTSLAGVHEGSERVASGAMELSATSEEMSATTAAIASQSNELHGGADRMAAAMTELSASIEQVSGNVRSAQGQMQQVLEATRAGEGAEEATRQAMEAIR